MSTKISDMSEILEMLNTSNTAAIEADRLQDDRLGKQMRLLTTTSERSHQQAAQSLQMLLLRYGESHFVPEGLFRQISKDGRRLDKKIIELNIAKKFPDFDVVGDPVTIQLQFQETKADWNENVLVAIRAAKVSTQKSNAVYSAIQLIAAQQDFSQNKGIDDILDA